MTNMSALQIRFESAAESLLNVIDIDNIEDIKKNINYFKDLSKYEYDLAMGAETKEQYFEEMEWSKYFEMKVAMCELILARYERDEDLRREISWSDGHDGE